MADKKVPEGAPASGLAPDEGVTIPRISLSEVGYTGLKTSSGAILAEANTAFRFPQFFKTIQEMRSNPTVGAAMNVYRFLMTRPEWRVTPPPNATPKEVERAKFVESCMGDMEEGWDSFIHSVVPYLEYGYSIHNIVPYRRLKRNGSKFNDGHIGIKKLSVRNQETISRWKFSDDGRDLIAVEQSIATLENSSRYQAQVNEHGLVEIPRDKFLLFSASASAGNPQGNSIYKNIYLSFKQLTMLQDQQLLSVAKSVQGMFKIEVPAEYLQGDKSPDAGAAAEAFKIIIDAYNNGTSRGLLLPQVVDQESKLKLFDYSIMDSKGVKQNDLESIIKGLQNDIAQALSVDILKLGADGSGSFSLAESKSSILALAIDARLKEIKAVLNKHLMRYIFEINGWETDNLPTFDYNDIEEIDLESAGKFIQQVFSVGALEFDREVANRVRKIFGVSPLAADKEVDKDSLPPNMTGKSTNAAEGMVTAGDGTGKSPMGKKDSSAANANNK